MTKYYFFPSYKGKFAYGHKTQVFHLKTDLKNETISHKKSSS